MRRGNELIAATLSPWDMGPYMFSSWPESRMIGWEKISIDCSSSQSSHTVLTLLITFSRIHFITIQKILDGFSARNFLDTDIDLPPHPDYVCLNSALLFSNFPSQFDVCTASATCLVIGSLYEPTTLMLKSDGSPWWSSSLWLWMNKLVSFFLNLCWCSPALV